MEWTLNNDGFCLTEPQLYRPWYNYLSNGDYGIKISHLGDGYATTLKEPRIAVTNYDFFSPCKGRYVYIQDGDSVWTPTFLPCKNNFDNWKCIHSPGVSSWVATKNGLKVTQSTFLPKHGTFEILTVAVENVSSAVKRFSVTPEIEYLLYNSFGVDPVYYSWYTDTKIEDNAILFERRAGGSVTGFFMSLEKPDSFETSLKRFFAGGDQQKPNALFSENLSNNSSGGDPYIGAAKYNLTLNCGETKTFAFFIGVGLDTLEQVKTDYKSITDVEKELLECKESWATKLSIQAFANASNIQDQDTKSWLNTFFGYQIYQQSTGLVRGTFRGFRDVAQDAMGICSFDAKIAKDLLIDLCKHQKSSGQCLRQWNTEGGANDERDFRDLPFWIIIALSVYERFTKDSSIYLEKAPYLDSTEEASLFEHAVQGIKYALVYGDHGLIKMGIGDWNDALSGPGVDGGTVFLNQFAYYALDLLEKASATCGLTHGIELEQHKQKLFDGVMSYWNGKWFARAVAVVNGEETKDSEQFFVLGGNGNESVYKEKTPVSSKIKFDGEERIFLLPQAWFTISGMAKHTEQAKAVAKVSLNSMLEKLETEQGLLKVEPGFSVFNKLYGNLSALAPGMAENYAIYNHAAAFAVYALFTANQNEDALRVLNKILPFKKDWKVTKAEPFVLVNFYNGGFYKDKAGEGGIPWLTGTVNWLAMSFFDFLLPNKIEL